MKEREELLQKIEKILEDYPDYFCLVVRKDAKIGDVLKNIR